MLELPQEGLTLFFFPSAAGNGSSAKQHLLVERLGRITIVRRGFLPLLQHSIVSDPLTNNHFVRLFPCRCLSSCSVSVASSAVLNAIRPVVDELKDLCSTTF